ncbi:uracil-xanthine permease family protein [Larsenimonas rhizosphaerae]|uniref:Nucleobase:cation symporter-2 family protein n=1 Tax=Larsenimonas rhizosphaerae TaxID=2944682 RepID=A0AA41ZER1_9GAMM|nr:nucleobase:cation symporter-2 family protein [Larsenimonas rhizosphaerae]MCM2130763.1 purine permease [Larsenimonas rhizosphaerae]MCX2523467.1 nucleobase:cation symporter-2 family protein [Larsenimonas rhizosphaerae]
MTSNDLVYQHGDRPPPVTAALVAFQHVLASFVGIIAPTIIVTNALGLGAEAPYLISLSLLISGISTFIQTRRFGPVGSGLLSVQGTSFSFVAALISAGMIARQQGADDQQVLATLFGICMAGSLIEVVLGGFLNRLRRLITPTVTGIVVTLIGLSLIHVGMTDIGGGFGAETFGAPANLLLALAVIVTVLACQLSRWPLLRVGSVFAGLVIGCILAAMFGMFTPPTDDSPLFRLPMPLHYGLDFNLAAFIPVAFVFLITAIETVGDLTGSSRASFMPTHGPDYQRRIRGGVIADGLNSLLAGFFNTFPNTTFSQNTGVIHLTGVASRHVGLYVGVILMALGLLPSLGGWLQQIPKPVLGATTTLMFGLIAVSGIRILAEQHMTRKRIMLIALSLGAGLGVQVVPDITAQLPDALKAVFSSSITTGGLVAIIGHLLMPERELQEKDEKNEAETTEPVAETSSTVNQAG